jgi:hypothetical protein
MTLLPTAERCQLCAPEPARPFVVTPNLTLDCLKLAWPERTERHLDEPCAYFGSIDPDSGATIIVPLTSGNVVEWAEALMERAL